MPADELETLFAACKCAVALAPDKLLALENEALRLAALVKNGRVPKGDAIQVLCDAATAHGLCKTAHDRQDAENVIRMGINGQSAGVGYSPPPQTRPDPKHNAPKSTFSSDSIRTVANSGSGAASSLVSRCAADIEPEKVEWLWHGRLARGKHTCIAGEQGTGKSQLSISIIAAVTTAGAWPCGEGQAPLGNAIILSAEDGAADTIVPRLLVAGACRERVEIISAVRNADGSRRAFNLLQDLSLLEKAIDRIGNVALVVVDPVSSYLGKTDSHKNSEVRGVLEPLGEMAERKRVAILSVTHFSKAGAQNTTKALHRFMGSIAFTAAPRAVFAVIEDAEHDGRRLLLHAKNNLARAPQGLAFRVEQCLVRDGIIASRIMWDAEPVAITANEALAADAAGSETRTAKAEGIEFLQAALAGGPIPAAEVQRMGREHGLTAKAIRSAREALGVEIARDGFGPGSKSLWSLPESTA
jgi:hypothetical protein